MSNKEVKQLIERLALDIQYAQSSEQIVAAVGKVKSYGKPLVYDHSRHYVVASLSAVLGIIVVASSHYKLPLMPTWSNQGANWSLIIGIACMVLSIALISTVFRAKKRIANVAALAYQKDAMLDNDLQEKAPFNSEEMRIRFSELNRGNHSRAFIKVIGGKFQGEEHQFQFDYYHFQYVNKRTVTRMHGKRMRTKTVYDKYDRFGLLIPFYYAKNMQIFSLQPDWQYAQKLSSGSIAFDKAFKIRADDELAASKFLKPAVIVAILDMSAFLSKMNIEIDATGLMCLSFNDSNMIAGNQRFDLSDPGAFYEELAGQTKLRRLDRTLRFVHQLLKHSDSNFKEIS